MKPSVEKAMQSIRFKRFIGRGLSLLCLTSMVWGWGTLTALGMDRFYSVHCSSFRLVSEADAEVDRLRKADYEAYYRTIEVPDKGTWYRVYVGKYAVRDDAKETAKRLMAEGLINYWQINAFREETGNASKAVEARQGAAMARVSQTEEKQKPITPEPEAPPKKVAAPQENKLPQVSRAMEEKKQPDSENPPERLAAFQPKKMEEKPPATERVAVKSEESQRSLPLPDRAEKVSGGPEMDSPPPQIAKDPKPDVLNPLLRIKANDGERPGVRLSLLDAIRYSLEGNQNIQIVSYNPRQAKEDLVSAEAAYDPSLFFSGRRSRTLQRSLTPNEPYFEDQTLMQGGVRKLLGTGATFSVFMETDHLESSKSNIELNPNYSAAPTVEVKQPLLKGLGSKAEASTIEIATHSVGISEAEYRQRVIEVVTEVSQIYWMLFMYWEFESINQAILQMAEDVYQQELVRLNQGLSRELDAERARSAIEARRTELARSKERVRTTAEELKFLINGSEVNIDSSAGIVPTEPPESVPVQVDENKAVDDALENRPELEKAREAASISKIRKDLAGHETLPTLDAVVRYSANGYGDTLSNSVDSMGIDGRDMWFVGLEFEWPFGNRSARAVHRKQSMEVEKAAVEVEKVKDQIKLEIKKAIHAVDLAREEIQSTSLEKEASENVVKGEYARFELGLVTNEEVLRAQERLALAERNNARAITNYNIALAELARARGALPRGLSVEQKDAGSGQQASR